MLRYAILVPAMLWAISAPAPAQTSLDCDYDSSGVVDFADFVRFAEAFGSDQARFDLHRNGVVNFHDFLILARLWGRKAGKEMAVCLPGGAVMEFIRILPGRFVMGSALSEPGHDDGEAPLHDVTFTQGVYLGKYEVTQGQWESVMRTRPWMDTWDWDRFGHPGCAGVIPAIACWHSALEMINFFTH